MASLTVRNLDPQVKERLRVRAAQHGRSMEDEVRRILQDITALPDPLENLATIAQDLSGAEHGIELELPPRAPERAAPSLG